MWYIYPMTHSNYTHEHIRHSQHLLDIAQPHSLGLGVHYEDEHLTHMGMLIPDEVLRQLKMLLGESLHTVSSYELDKAAMNFKATGQVVVDANGKDLEDMMHVHWGEAEADDKWKISAPERPEWNASTEQFATNDEIELHADDDTPPFSFVQMLNPVHAAERVMLAVMV